MAGDPFRRVSAGEPFSPSADKENLLSDLARFYLRGRDRISAATIDTGTPGGLILVRNNSGADRARFDVLGIAGVVIQPSVNLLEFQNRPAVAGDTPNKSGQFVILAEPIKSGLIGRAWLTGYCAAQVNFGSSSDGFADATPGDCTQLTSTATAGTGLAQVLWSPGATGKQWALVRLGAGGASAIHTVTLSKDGGSAGTNGPPPTAATFTYTATDTDSRSVLGTAMPVWFARQRGHMTAATNGFAKKIGGTWYVLVCDEVIDTGSACT